MNTALILIIFIPLIEIYLFIKIGAQIGAFNTVSLILITAIMGIYYARYEGLKTQIEKLLKFGAIDWVDIYKDPDIRKKLDHNSQLVRSLHVDGWRKNFY